MEKIRQLLVKSGLSDEAATKICESMQDHDKSVREHYQQEFNTKLAEVKDACLAETNKHKSELSRRVQIFLEAKDEAVQQQLLKQSAERGTKAESKLERIAALVEGVELNGQPNTELQAEVGKLKGIVKSLTEQRDKAVEKATRLLAINEKVLGRNKTLETQVAKSGKQTVSESRVRQGARPVTTRRVLEETVERPAQRQAKPQTMALTPDAIADLI